MFIKSSQYPITSVLRVLSHWLISSWWKPSSHRNPLGKNDLEGTPVYKELSQ